MTDIKSNIEIRHLLAHSSQMINYVHSVSFVVKPYGIWHTKILTFNCNKVIKRLRFFVFFSLLSNFWPNPRYLITLFIVHVYYILYIYNTKYQKIRDTKKEIVKKKNKKTKKNTPRITKSKMKISYSW